MITALRNSDNFTVSKQLCQVQIQRFKNPQPISNQMFKLKLKPLTNLLEAKIFYSRTLLDSDFRTQN